MILKKEGLWTQRAKAQEVGEMQRMCEQKESLDSQGAAAGWAPRDKMHCVVQPENSMCDPDTFQPARVPDT